MATILLLSGPNVNLFGFREPEVYGYDTLDDMVGDARDAAAKHGYDLEHVHSNHEGDLVEAVQAARGRVDAIVVNPGALAHYGLSLADALRAFEGVKVELHVSNPSAREPFRHLSVIAPAVSGVVAGFGRPGYRLAVDAAAALLAR